MKLIANSVVAVGGTTYRPGQMMGDVPAIEAGHLLAVGYAVPAPGAEPDPEPAPETEPAPAPAADSDGKIHGPLGKDQMAELTKAQLEELAHDMGINTAKLRTKAALIEAICAVPVETDAAAATTADGGKV